MISNAQLHWAGLLPDAITRRVRSGRLHRLYRGVYAVGHTGILAKGAGWQRSWRVARERRSPSADLGASDITRRHNIPLTTLARTTQDLG